MRKTKIICTLGPSTDKEGVLRDLIANGMNVARFNFSHGSHEEHLGRLEKLKALREELGKPVAALLDTKGPEIRLKDFKNGVENLVAGQTFTLTTRDVEGTNEICSITYKDLPMDVEPNGTIMLDDGLIKLQIQTVNDTDIVCTVLNNGKIKNKKGVNVPGVHLSMPYMSQRDKDDIIFGIQQGYDFIAASFVRTAQDVYDIRNLLNQYDSNIRIIAKIENREGVNNIDSILAAADAVMVARGDLGVEIDFTELPGIQKTIIDRSFSFGKPIVTATQMLDSMIVNPRPTRAEISDVANAIYDGTSAIMLSGETAAGAYPVEALKTMSAIAERTEQEGFHLRGRQMDSNPGKISVSDATAHAACLTARDVNAAAIVTVSESGTTARLLSKYRPQQPIIACVMREQVQRQLSLSWGITPLMMSLAHSTDELIEMSTALAKENGYLHNGELAVVTAGVPVGVSGTTNMIKIHMVGNCLATGVGVGPENNDVASGKACVCRTMDEVRAKFKPGMVLVVPSTSNEMLSFVRDAAALVVEEPGLNSHAAIAGKALLKPTVVGAAGATSHIRDGLMVAVDCAHGSVQRLQG
ncbi:pyruvate kinase [Faecalibacterium prausnitzii]|jgi:pyruvate kinase|uniref:Pyruvate kinase n=1 Tax=Faecalibacterium prausnitzii TaxID=853 RepID=A0A2A7A6W6_9FIRM|nr:pyruvate kinase [Faecalibacterium prausnitzii]UYI71695.1 MAG: pyruvate kinase [Oscillospiraceae bacterium]MDW2997011.1 pyruvate kinase [Faecalibacterium prausnitzii]MEE0069306.1 pyruvate kinase [Faecalibacterium prausnitzii]MSC66657.1 pyruvate kinase [Faecalibacterium prausnitzii]MSC70834.1 pyruvate kinase [Faecalibacterium prausnitzii]